MAKYSSAKYANGRIAMVGDKIIAIHPRTGKILTGTLRDPDRKVKGLDGVLLTESKAGQTATRIRIKEAWHIEDAYILAMHSKYRLSPTQNRKDPITT